MFREPFGRPPQRSAALYDMDPLVRLQLNSTKVKLTPEIEAENTEGFEESDVGVARDNARQRKFKAESTGFED